MIVAVHDHRRLRQRVGDQQLEGLLQRVPVVVVERHLPMPFHVPHRIEVELAGKQRAIVGREDAGAAGHLQAHERGAGLAVEDRRGLLVQGLQVGERAEIIEQQEALFDIGGQHARHAQSGRAHDRGGVDEGPAVLLRGRRIHHHQAVG